LAVTLCGAGLMKVRLSRRRRVPGVPKGLEAVI
jgi:hypothetical protein